MMATVEEMEKEINRVKKEAEEEKREFAKKIDFLNNEIKKQGEALTCAIEDVAKRDEIIRQQENRIERLECLHGRPSELVEKVERLRNQNDQSLRKNTKLKLNFLEVRSDLKKKLEEVDRQLESTTARLEECQLENEKLRVENNDHEDQLRREKQEKEQLKDKISDLVDELDVAKSRGDILKKRMAVLLERDQNGCPQN